MFFAYPILKKLVQNGFGNVQGFGQMKKMIDGVQKSRRNACHTPLQLHLSVVELKLVTKSQNTAKKTIWTSRFVIS